MAEHYIIGDVHGMLPQLEALLARLPKPHILVFTGDLIDRGPFSAEVVELVRSRGYRCVRGNHEQTFIAFFRDYFGGMDLESVVEKWLVWIALNGGKETLESYGFLQDPKNPAILERIRKDMEWMASLPLYIELGPIHPSGLPVVVSHSNITKVWHLRNDLAYRKLFEDTALRTRDLECDPQSGILNVFGHTPLIQRRLGPHCIDVDGGCCYQKEGLSTLVAFCVQEDRFIFEPCA